MHFNIFPGQHIRHTLMPMRPALESKVKSKHPFPLSLNQPDVLHAELYKIPLENIQNLSASVPRRLQLYYRQMVA